MSNPNKASTDYWQPHENLFAIMVSRHFNGVFMLKPDELAQRIASYRDEGLSDTIFEALDRLPAYDDGDGSISREGDFIAQFYSDAENHPEGHPIALCWSLMERRLGARFRQAINDAVDSIRDKPSWQNLLDPGNDRAFLYCAWESSDSLGAKIANEFHMSFSPHVFRRNHAVTPEQDQILIALDELVCDVRLASDQDRLERQSKWDPMIKGEAADMLKAPRPELEHDAFHWALNASQLTERRYKDRAGRDEAIEALAQRIVDSMDHGLDDKGARDLEHYGCLTSILHHLRTRKQWALVIDLCEAAQRRGVQDNKPNGFAQRIAHAKKKLGEADAAKSKRPNQNTGPAKNLTLEQKLELLKRYNQGSPAQRKVLHLDYDISNPVMLGLLSFFDKNTDPELAERIKACGRRKGGRLSDEEKAQFANRWPDASSEERKALLEEFGISQKTGYRIMQDFPR